jgi:two-component system, OmpR family, alkaline phosphatase synthesis response regulator PhoP
MNQLQRILVVEDEPSLGDTIKLNLELEGYKAHLVTDGRSALKIFKSERFNLIVLDVMLPELDGFSVCEAIRLDNSKVPILFLTAKNSSQDRVNGLKLGGDDYLTKPFNLEEFLLRVQNLLKRSNNYTPASSVDEYKLGQKKIKFGLMQIIDEKGEEIKLTKKECSLLKLLVERKNEVVSREHILETVWGYDIYPSTRTIDNFIVTFRKYFEPDPGNPKYFHSVRGVGYKYTEVQ